MKKPDKASVRYTIGFILLSFIQLCLIYGLITSPEGKYIQTELYMDGADFSPFLSLFNSGINSLVFVISVFIDMMLGAVLSLIAMRLLRKRMLHMFTSETGRFDILLTVILGILFLLIACTFSRFRMIFDTFLLYIPVPLVSCLAYHLGKQENDAEN